MGWLLCASDVHSCLKCDERVGMLQAEEVVTSGYKWLRAVGRSEFTGLHTDRVFLGRGESLHWVNPEEHVKFQLLHRPVPHVPLLLLLPSESRQASVNAALLFALTSGWDL